jgi:hypothetical protein
MHSYMNGTFGVLGVRVQNHEPHDFVPLKRREVACIRQVSSGEAAAWLPGFLILLVIIRVL